MRTNSLASYPPLGKNSFEAVIDFPLDEVFVFFLMVEIAGEGAENDLDDDGGSPRDEELPSSEAEVRIRTIRTNGPEQAHGVISVPSQSASITDYFGRDKVDQTLEKKETLSAVNIRERRNSFKLLVLEGKVGRAFSRNPRGLSEKNSILFAF